MLFGASVGLNFCDYWSNPQVSDDTADDFSNWTDSWLVPEGNFFESGTNASLKGGGPVRVTWQSSNGWSAGSEADNEKALYREYLDDGNTGGGIGVRVTVTNMSRWLALNEHTSYQVRCYANNDSAITYCPISIRNGSVSGSVLESMTVAPMGDGSYPPGSPPASGESRGYGDSTTTLTADTVSLTIPNRSGATRGTLSAFKITGIGSGPPVDHFESGDGMVSVINAALGSGLTSTFRAGLDTPTVTGSFSVIPAHKIKVVQPSSGFMVDTYDLLKLPAGTSVNLGDLSLSTLPRGAVGQLEMVDNGGTNPVLRLNVTEMNVPSALYWTGNIAGGTWDIDAAANWSYESSPSTYLEGDEVVFDDSVTGTTSVALNVPVLPFSVKVDNDATHPYTITGSGAINGAGTFTKLGVGSLTLGTANAYSGLTSIQGGAVTLESNTALGSAAAGTTVADGAKLDLNGRDINGEGLTLSGSGPAGDGALVNESTTTAATAAGPITLANAPVVVGGAGDLSLTGVVSGSGSASSLVKTGDGTLTLGANNNFTGGTVVNKGRLFLDKSNDGFDNSRLRGTLTVNDPGTLEMANVPFGWGGGLTEINLNDSVLTGTGGLGTWGIVYNLKGATIMSSGRLDLGPYNGVDPAINSLASDFTSTVTVSEILIRFDADNWDRLTCDVEAGTTPDGIDLQINSRINQDWCPTGHLVKTGSGTLALIAGNSVLAGTTLVDAGTLLLNNNSGSATGTGSLDVAASATLGGSGIATGAALIDGTVSPGSPADPQGSLDLGATTLNGTLAVRINGAACSQLSVTGNLTLGAAAAITLSGTPTEPVYVLASCSGTLTGTFTTAAPAGYHFAYSPTSVSLVSNSAGYAGWIGTSGAAPADQGLNADPDHDGVANGLEYVLGGNAATGMDAAKLPAGQLSGGNFVFSFDRRVSSETPDIALSFQHGTDLVGWTTISVDAANPPTVTITRSGDNLTDHVVVTLPASGTTKFGRLKVTTP